jgi:hypothetical protein
MFAEFVTKGRETLIVKIPIDSPWQPPSPCLRSLFRTVSGRSPLNENRTDLMLKEPHMHYFVL